MNNNLLRRIEEVRATLNADPEGVIIGSLPSGAVLPDSLTQMKDYPQFLAVTNGAQCGETIFHRCEDLEQHRLYYNYLEGGDSQWLVVGRVAHRILVLKRHVGTVHLFDFKDEPAEHRVYDRLDNFLDVVFSERYLELTGDYEDDWYKLLVHLQLA